MRQEIPLLPKEKVGLQPPVQVEKRLFEILERAFKSNNLDEFQDFIYGIEKVNVFAVLNIESHLNSDLRVYHSSFQRDVKRGYNSDYSKRKYFTILHEMAKRPKILMLNDYQSYQVVAQRVYNCLEVLIIWFEESFHLKEYLNDNQRNELIRMIFFRFKKLSLEEIALVLRSAKMGEYGQVKYQLDISHFSEYMKIIQNERKEFFRTSKFNVELIDPHARAVDDEKVKAFIRVLNSDITK